MIQRIQTLYLLVVIGLLTSLFFVPFAELRDIQDNLFKFNVVGVKAISGNGELLFFAYHFLLIIGLAILAAFVAILKYKNRILQIRLCIFTILLLLGFYGMLFFLINQVKNQFSADIFWSIPVVFPVLSVILIFLAIRSIRKDIILLRSYDRIR
jgi:hypothetical protein